MTADDLAVFARDLAVETKSYVEESIGGAVRRVHEDYSPRVDRLEARLAALEALREEAQREAVAVKAAVRDEVARLWAEAPPRDGKDGAAGRDGKDGAPGLDGKDGAPGRDGKDGAPGLNGKDGASGVDGKDGAAGLNGKDGRDGIGVAGAVVTRQGTVVITLSDGQTKDIGHVVADPADVARFITEQLATWPRPQDGAPGPPGRDGTLEDLRIEYDGKRTLSFYRKDDTLLKEIVWAVPLDEGVWQPGVLYAKGAGVTWGGSFWIAQEATRAKPGESGLESRAWRLAVKRGTDGKPGRDGKDAE